MKRAVEYIEAGDAFQIVLSLQFRMPLQVDPLTIYRQLRLVNPSPDLFFVRCGGPVLIGSSPESQVRLQDGQIDLRPIAGTRRRGGSAPWEQTVRGACPPGRWLRSHLRRPHPFPSLHPNLGCSACIYLRAAP